MWKSLPLRCTWKSLEERSVPKDSFHNLLGGICNLCLFRALSPVIFHTMLWSFLSILDWWTYVSSPTKSLFRDRSLSLSGAFLDNFRATSSVVGREYHSASVALITLRLAERNLICQNLCNAWGSRFNRRSTHQPSSTTLPSVAIVRLAALFTTPFHEQLTPTSYHLDSHINYPIKRG